MAGWGCEPDRSHKELDRNLKQVTSKLEEAVGHRQTVDLECGRLREEIVDLNRQYLGESEQMATRLAIAEAQLRKAVAECDVLKGRVEHLEMQRKTFNRTVPSEANAQGEEAPERPVAGPVRASGLNVVAISEITARPE